MFKPKKQKLKDAEEEEEVEEDIPEEEEEEEEAPKSKKPVQTQAGLSRQEVCDIIEGNLSRAVQLLQLLRA